MKDKLLLLIFTSLILCHLSAYAGIQKAFSIYSDKTIAANTKIERMTYELLDSHYYFAASIMAAKRLERPGRIDERFKKALEELSVKVGIDYLWEANLNKEHIDSTVAFSLALKSFRSQDYQKAQEYLQIIKSDDKYYPESKMILGTVLSMSNRPSSAKREYQSCIVSATKAAGQTDNERQARYYKLIAEDCQINIARDLYRQKKYLMAIDEYDKITKNSYRWPYLLLEKAWAFYQLNDFNRALGLLVTYKSPLLESYFFPESEVLAALSYFKLCLWNDTNIIINRYYSDYKNKASELKTFIESNKNTKNFYYLLATNKTDITQSEYAQNIIVQAKKQVKYSLDIVPIQRGEKELEQLNKLPSNVFTQFLQKKVASLIEQKKGQLNQFLAHNFYDFLNQIHRYSKELFIMQLEILAQKRTLLYQEEKLISNRSRGDLSNVKRESSQHFWDFSGAFWADELGEYSFGLKSNCQRIGSKNEKK